MQAIATIGLDIAKSVFQVQELMRPDGNSDARVGPPGCLCGPIDSALVQPTRTGAPARRPCDVIATARTPRFGSSRRIW